jgi:hypothetical protein
MATSRSRQDSRLRALYVGVGSLMDINGRATKKAVVHLTGTSKSAKSDREALMGDVNRIAQDFRKAEKRARRSHGR